MSFQSKRLDIELTRYFDPCKSLLMAEQLLETSSTNRHVVIALGEWGSSFRAIGRYPEATEILDLALKTAGTELGLRSDLLRRVAALKIMTGHLPAAISLTKDSILLAVEAFDERGIGLALLVQASAKHHLGLLSDSVRENKAAFSYLSDSYDRFFGYLNRAHSLHALGEEKERDICLARALNETVREEVRYKAEWVRAEIDLQVGRFEQSARRFQLLADFYFSSRQATDAALATCLRVEALRKSGRLADAKTTAAAAARLVMPLHGDKLAAAAIMDLVRKALDPDWTVDAKTVLSVLTRLRKQASI